MVNPKVHDLRRSVKPRLGVHHRRPPAAWSLQAASPICYGPTKTGGLGSDRYYQTAKEATHGTAKRR